jgi:hypothetical protein
MIDSILNSIKKSLDIDEDYDAFDDVIMMHINSQFSVLFSIGACGPEPFMILGSDEKWSDYYGDIKQAQMVKTYIFLKVKVLFDSASMTSFTLNAFQEQAKELEWRLSIMEFVFNPNSEPVDSPADNQRLRELEEQIDAVENSLEDLDTEVEQVPDLTAIFKAGQQVND